MSWVWKYSGYVKWFKCVFYTWKWPELATGAMSAMSWIRWRYRTMRFWYRCIPYFLRMKPRSQAARLWPWQIWIKLRCRVQLHTRFQTTCTVSDCSRTQLLTLLIRPTISLREWCTRHNGKSSHGRMRCDWTRQNDYLRSSLVREKWELWQNVAKRDMTCANCLWFERSERCWAKTWLPSHWPPPKVLSTYYVLSH